MLHRSKSQKSPRRGATPAQAADVAADAPVVAAVPEADPAPAVVSAAATDAVPGADPMTVTDAVPGPDPVMETDAAPGADPVMDTDAAPGPDPVMETDAAPGSEPVVETAPPGTDPAGPTKPAPVLLAAPPVPPSPDPRASGALITTLMETPMQQATKATETMMKAAEEAVEFGRGNVEAFTKATQIYVAGVQDLGKQTFAVVQGMADHAMESARALSGVKSLQEAVQLQSSFARAAIEKSVSESAKLSETALKLTEQTFAPLTARMSLAAEKITKVPAAA